ncbi:MAG: tetratricopeptide repeat protein [Candidatus Marinimicrobia bacterium]|nr:tetratricopeptide repeat protein [Candidatus Neomarinimicrobiota bacterium]
MKRSKISVLTLALLMCSGLFAQDNLFTRIWTDLNAYFNTYYNAKVYFKGAQESYNAEEDKEKLSSGTRNALNKAAKQAQVVMDKFPGSSFIDDVMFYNGVCQYQLGMYERALEQLESLTLRYPDSRYYFEAKLWISKCYFEMDRKTIAYELLEQFLENSGNRAYFSDAYSLMGYLALQEKDSTRALNAFLRSAEHASDKHTRCNMYLEAVGIQLDRGQYGEALTYTNRARRNIKFDEQRAKVQLAYIRAYRQQEAFEKVEEYIEEALKDARISNYWGDVIYEEANLCFDRGRTKTAVSKLRDIVEDAENQYRHNKSSHAWARAAYRLGQYYLFERSDIDSADYFFKRAQTKQRESEEGSRANDYVKILSEVERIKHDLSELEKAKPQLTDSAWVHYELLKDSVRTEKNEREHLLADTLSADSSTVDSLLRIADSDYRRFEDALSGYMESSVDYTESLFNLAGVFLFDLYIPDTALQIYTKISREFYYTPAVPKALYSQAYVWEYELHEPEIADSIKYSITTRFPDSGDQ